MNLAQIKVEYLISFSDALFAFSIILRITKLAQQHLRTTVNEINRSRVNTQYHPLCNQFPCSRDVLDWLSQDIRIYKKDQLDSDLAQLGILALYFISNIFHRSSFYLQYL
jgi:hypothetical protein